MTHSEKPTHPAPVGSPPNTRSPRLNCESRTEQRPRAVARTGLMKGGTHRSPGNGSGSGDGQAEFRPQPLRKGTRGSSNCELLSHPAPVSPWLSRILYPLGCRLFLPLYFGNIDVVGRENLPQTGPAIVAPLHRSRWDALIVPYAVGRWVTGRDLHYMVSANEMRGVQGFFVKNMGGFAVDPERPTLQSIRDSITLLSLGEVVVIFPEGDIFRNQPVQPLKVGVARMALQAHSHFKGSDSVKVVPMAVRYSQDYPSWGTQVRAIVGPPLDVADYGDLPPKKGAQKLTASLQNALETLENQSLSLCDSPSAMHR